MKRTAAERKLHPSRPVLEAPAVCTHCRPLLENEQAMHREAFETIAKALDAALQRAEDAEARLIGGVTSTRNT